MFQFDKFYDILRISGLFPDWDILVISLAGCSDVICIAMCIVHVRIYSTSYTIYRCKIKHLWIYYCIFKLMMLIEMRHHSIRVGGTQPLYHNFIMGLYVYSTYSLRRKSLTAKLKKKTCTQKLYKWKDFLCAKCSLGKFKHKIACQTVVLQEHHYKYATLLNKMTILFIFCSLSAQYISGIEVEISVLNTRLDQKMRFLKFEGIA